MDSMYSRRRGTFSAKLHSEHVVLSRLDSFWKKFSTLMKSNYAQESTPGSMLGTVLIALVEARQVCDHQHHRHLFDRSPQM